MARLRSDSKQVSQLRRQLRGRVAPGQSWTDPSCCDKSDWTYVRNLAGELPIHKGLRQNLAEAQGALPVNAETHLVEWKESWRDEYLRWLCGFANADGGTLIIGKNDKGEPVGAPDAKRLLVDLPNKIRDTLGPVVAVRALTSTGKTLVEIDVEASPTPITVTKASITSVRAAPSSSSRATRSLRSCSVSSAATVG